MIDLVNLSKSYYVDNRAKAVIRPATLTLPVNRRVALLGGSNSGKTVLMRLITGADDPTTGHVSRRCSLSWPFASGAGINIKISGAANVRFISQLYLADFRSVLAMVDELTELRSALYDPMFTYPAAMRGKLFYALSLAIDFDCYLVDEHLLTGTADRVFRAKAQAILERKLNGSGMLYASQNENKVKPYCTAAVVLHAGRLFPFESLDDGGAFYRALKRH
jgi:capsular polysaccharide transport system ATP-binding protein